MNQKGVAHVLFVLILLVGIIAGVFLVGRTQIFKPKATGANIEILSNECTRTITGTTTDKSRRILTCAEIQLKLISPLETGNAASSDAGFSLTKPVFAASESIGGIGYSCEKEGGDRSKIYHKQCNAIILGINLCDLKIIPGTHYDLIQQGCDIGLECETTTTDLFNNVAKCSPASVQPSRNFHSPTITQPGSRNSAPLFEGNGILPSPSGGNDSSSLPPADNTVSPTNTPSPAPTTPAEISLYHTPVTSGSSPNPAPSSAPAPAASNNVALNTGTGATAPNIGTGGTNPNTGTGATNPTTPETKRITLGFRVAETKDGLDTAVWHDSYKAGGVNYNYTLQDITEGPKFFFVQFRDQDKKVIKFDSGNDFDSATIDFDTSSSSSPQPSSAAARATTVPTSAPTSAPTTAPTSAPTSAPTTAPASVPASAACDLGGDIANWRNCTFLH